VRTGQNGAPLAPLILITTYRLKALDHRAFQDRRGAHLGLCDGLPMNHNLA
jgi:hypothetical protein